MIPPFADHPLVREFNVLKKYFRKFETPESRQRIRDFREFARLITSENAPVGFDFVGSINFGQAELSSDVDFVVYVICDEHPHHPCPVNCRRQYEIKNFMLESLTHQFSDHPYNIDVIDLINLNLLEREIERGDPESPTLLSFAFYRSIGRAVNQRLIRPYQQRLARNRPLIEAMRPNVHALFDGLCRSMPHNLSFRKYQQRIQASGAVIPPLIRDAIVRHFEVPAEEASDGAPGTAAEAAQSLQPRADGRARSEESHGT